MPDILADEESPTSSKSDPDIDCDISEPGSTHFEAGHGPSQSGTAHGASDSCDNGDDIFNQNFGGSQIRGASFIHWNGSGERRRRKLPEIPKNKKCKF